MPPQVGLVPLLSNSLGALLHSLWNPKDRRKLKMCNLTKRAVMIFTVRLKSARFHRCESADASQASSNILWLRRPPGLLLHICGNRSSDNYCEYQCLILLFLVSLLLCDIEGSFDVDKKQQFRAKRK